MPKTTPCMNPQKGAASFVSAVLLRQCSSATASLPRQSCVGSIAEQWSLTGSITLIAVASLALPFECQRARHATVKIPPLQGTA